MRQVHFHWICYWIGLFSLKVCKSINQWICLLLDVNPRLYERLKIYEAKLKEKAEEIKIENKKLIFKNNNYNNLIKQRKNTLDNNLKTLYKSNNTISNTNNSLISLNTQEEISGLSMRSNYMIYLFWILIFILAINLVLNQSIDYSNVLISKFVYIILLLFLVLIFLYSFT